MEKGILDVVGGEIVGIVTPVSICMFLVVSLVHILDPRGEDAPVSNIAMMVYDEQATDSFSEKLGGALLNAVVFVVIVTLVTFVLFALFYYRCTKCLRVYMGFSSFTVLCWMGGIVAAQIIKKYSIPIDLITFLIVTINIASVGVAAVFFCRMPIAVTQGYLIAIGMLVAFWFTKLPEWTTWVLLLAMAAYDVVAVLTPRGPLNLLVELAMERDEDIPALIYEARPTVPAGTMRMPPPQAQMAAADRPRRERRWGRPRSSNEPPQGTDLQETSGENGLVSGAPTEPEVGILGSRLVSATGEAGTLHAFSTAVNENQVSDDDRAPLVQRQSESSTTPQLEHRPRAVNGGSQHLEEDDEHMGLGLSGAIKLGLGDFVFYSVLVGRAAMYDLMTVYACYLAIVAGLGATLVLLAVWKRALPALPISISLGVVFYFLARLIVDPFILDMSSNLVFF